MFKKGKAESRRAHHHSLNQMTYCFSKIAQISQLVVEKDRFWGPLEIPKCRLLLVSPGALAQPVRDDPSKQQWLWIFVSCKGCYCRQKAVPRGRWWHRCQGAHHLLPSQREVQVLHSIHRSFNSAWQPAEIYFKVHSTVI